MRLGRSATPGLTAALAGVPSVIQPHGPWCGRRQLVIKFAGEAETATIYTAAGLGEELVKLAARSCYHSIVIAGRDALLEHEFLTAALKSAPSLPVMLDHDGQRADELDHLMSALKLVQVTMDGTEGATAVERVMATLGITARKHVAHAVVLLPGEGASDAPLLRIVEQIHAVSEDAGVVVHPVSPRAGEQDRRWTAWLEQAMAIHGDIRLLPRSVSGTIAR